MAASAAACTRDGVVAGQRWRGDRRNTAPFTFAKLKQGAIDAIKTSPCSTSRRRITSKGALWWSIWHSSPTRWTPTRNAPLVKVFYDEVEIELLRGELLQRQASRQIMAPYYAKMEATLSKKIAVLQDAKLEPQARDDQLDKLEEQSRKTLSDGLQAVATSIGMEKFEFSVGAALDCARRETCRVGRGDDRCRSPNDRRAAP